MPLSLAGVLSLGFLLLISMLVTTVLAAGGKYLGSYLPALHRGHLHGIVRRLLFAMMFKWLPDAKGFTAALADRTSCITRGRGGWLDLIP
jgi:hypothetical protein